jgi:hypothetical protein
MAARRMRAAVQRKTTRALAPVRGSLVAFEAKVYEHLRSKGVTASAANRLAHSDAIRDAFRRGLTPALAAEDAAIEDMRLRGVRLSGQATGTRQVVAHASGSRMRLRPEPQPIAQPARKAGDKSGCACRYRGR